jgi:superfamily II DNA or RNA helicase
MKLRPYQQQVQDETYEAWSQGMRNVCVVSPTGSGKCLGEGTPILMYNGEITPVENIKTGDLLSGPDDKPRKVLSICTGHEMLYKVTPIKGDPYVVNESHILSLKRTGEHRNDLRKGEIVNISVRDYMSKTKYFKHIHKGWRCGRSFSEKKYSEFLPPYFLGLWLGDGTKRHPHITTADSEIVEYLYEFAKQTGQQIKDTSTENRCSTYSISNDWKRGKTLTQLKKYDLICNKHIPLIYKTGSNEQRLELLAGLIDSDGYLNHNYYDIIQKIKTLADDIAYIARSLGFAAYVKKCTKTCYNNGVSNTYYRISISGEGMEDIPVILKRLKASPRKQAKSVLTTGIKVEQVGIGKYYGFTIDQDHLFMLGDFTVTHNTVLFANTIHRHNEPSVVIAHRQELVGQISLALNREEVPHKIIGPKSVVKFCCDIHYQECGKSFYNPSASCAVAGVDTLVRRDRELKEWANTVTLWVIDECFPAGTLVDGTPIEKLKVGQKVTAFNEETGDYELRRINRLFKNPSPNHMVRLETKGHHVITSTKGHPFWTKRGWVDAGNLTLDDEVLIHAHNSEMYNLSKSDSNNRKMENKTLAGNRSSILLTGLLKRIQKAGIFGDNGKDQQKIRLRTNEEKQPNERCGNKEESLNDIEKDGSQTESKRWKRETSYRSRIKTLRDAWRYWFRESTNSKNRIGWSLTWLPQSLQNRLWSHRVKNSDRSRREQSWDDKKTRTRSTQRPSAYWCGLESVSILERRDIDRTSENKTSDYVYNIEVEGLHTYVANGITVHNCHHISKSGIEMFNKWGQAVKMFPNAKGLGVTATPLRADGKGLGRHADGVFDTMVIGPSMRDLINDKFLTEYRIFAPPNDIDLHNVTISTATGDYSKNKLTTAVRKSHIVGDVVQHYKRIANGKLGVTFATDVETATEIAAQFNDAGVPAEVVSAKTPDRDRTAIIRRFRNRELLQLVNVDLFGEGFDLPAIEVVSMARPTQSYGLYVQQFGRSLRPLDGKLFALIIDHVGNVVRHGLPDSPKEWTLDRREKRSSGTPDDVIPVKACVHCTAVYERIHKICPECGFENPPQGRSLPEQVDGDLIELDAATLAQMRGDIEIANRTPMEVAAELQAKHAPEIGVKAAMKRQRERLQVNEALRQALAHWCGARRSQGMSDSEVYRRFYFKYGTDVLTAQTLPAKEALTLAEKVWSDL